MEIAQATKCFENNVNVTNIHEEAVRQLMPETNAINPHKLTFSIQNERCWCYSSQFDAATYHENSVSDMNARVCVEAVVTSFYIHVILICDTQKEKALF